jgi:hypothetical protein
MTFVNIFLVVIVIVGVVEVAAVVEIVVEVARMCFVMYLKVAKDL